MLSKAQIINFLKLRKSDDLLYNIKNIIIIAMVKYYKDLSIISFVDHISLKSTKRKGKVLTILKNNNYIITVNYKLTTLNKIEYILNEINYIYNNNTCEKEPLKETISLLQTEDIIKLLFKIIRLNSIEEFEELSSIDSKSYKIYIKQIETNLFRPIYNHYKKRDKSIIKNTERLIKKIDEETNNKYIYGIKDLYYENSNNEDEVLLVSENYRRIKDIINNVLKDINN